MAGMHTLPHHRRILLLTEGRLGVHTSKTAAVLLRYRAADVVGVIDGVAAGQVLAQHIAWAPHVPILPDVSAARGLRPDAVYIGVAPVGGGLPPEMRGHVCAALQAGLDVVSGLHDFLADDAELAALSAASGARIFDVRRPPAERIVAAGRARETRCRRVLTVGTDANVGKMVTALELTRAAQQRGLRAAFVPTGQTGIMVTGHGITIDACVADFVAGAVEHLVCAVADCDICFVEGQGSLAHPGFSGVTVSLLHGACADALILVHALGRTHYKAPPHEPLPELPALIAGYEQMAAWLHPARVVGLAVNTHGQPDDACASALARWAAELRMPVVDPIRTGCDALLDAVLKPR